MSAHYGANEQEFQQEKFDRWRAFISQHVRRLLLTGSDGYFPWRWPPKPVTEEDVVKFLTRNITRSR